LRLPEVPDHLVVHRRVEGPVLLEIGILGDLLRQLGVGDRDSLPFGGLLRQLLGDELVQDLAGDAELAGQGLREVPRPPLPEELQPLAVGPAEVAEGNLLPLTLAGVPEEVSGAWNRLPGRAGDEHWGNGEDEEVG
jgi:hypothetical protein